MNIIQFLTELVLVIIPVLIAFISYQVKVGSDAAKKAVDLDEAAKYIDWISAAIIDAVEAVAQTFVDTLKKEGSFTEERQAEAVALAKNKIDAILTPLGRQILGAAYGDIDAWILAKIEASVREGKAPEIVIIE